MATTHGLRQSGTLCLRFWFRRCETHGLMFRQFRFRCWLLGTHWLRLGGQVRAAWDPLAVVQAQVTGVLRPHHRMRVDVFINNDLISNLGLSH